MCCVVGWWVFRYALWRSVVQLSTDNDGKWWTATQRAQIANELNWTAAMQRERWGENDRERKKADGIHHTGILHSKSQTVGRTPSGKKSCHKERLINLRLVIRLCALLAISVYRNAKECVCVCLNIQGTRAKCVIISFECKYFASEYVKWHRQMRTYSHFNRIEHFFESMSLETTNKCDQTREICLSL